VQVASSQTLTNERYQAGKAHNRDNYLDPQRISVVVKDWYNHQD
jgi:hypothetical protein